VGSDCSDINDNRFENEVKTGISRVLVSFPDTFFDFILLCEEDKFDFLPCFTVRC